MKKILFTLAIGSFFMFSCSNESDALNEKDSVTLKTTDVPNNYYSPYDAGSMMPIMIIVENNSNEIFEFFPCFNIGYFDGVENDGAYFGNPTSSYPNVFHLSGLEYRQQIYGENEYLKPGEIRKYSNDNIAGLPLTPNSIYNSFTLPPAFTNPEKGLLEKFGKLFYIKYQFIDPVTGNQFGGGSYLRNDPPFTLGSASYDPSQYDALTTTSIYGALKYYNFASREVFEDDYDPMYVNSTILDSGYTLTFTTYANYIHIVIS